MGRERLEIRIVGSRSAHNSLQDEMDTAKWRSLRWQINALLKDGQYESLGLMIEGPGLDEDDE